MLVRSPVCADGLSFGTFRLLTVMMEEKCIVAVGDEMLLELLVSSSRKISPMLRSNSKEEGALVIMVGKHNTKRHVKKV